MNHSDNPNISAEDALVAHALRDIKRGEEIFIDYTKIRLSTDWKSERPSTNFPKR
jgi:SET domain-containing protein